MKQVKVEIFLGDQLSITSAEYVTATVNKRICIATHAVYEIRSVVEDSRVMTVGGLTVNKWLSYQWFWETRRLGKPYPRKP